MPRNSSPSAGPAGVDETAARAAENLIQPIQGGADPALTIEHADVLHPRRQHHPARAAIRQVAIGHVGLDRVAVRRCAAAPRRDGVAAHLVQHPRLQGTVDQQQVAWP